LKKMFHSAKEKYGTRVIVITTFSEDIQTTEKENRKIAIALALNDNRETFTSKQVYLVSARRKVLGTDVQHFIETYQRMMRLKLEGEDEDENDPVDNAEAQLAEAFVEAMHADSYEEKLEVYREFTTKQALTRAQGLINSSNMNEVTSNLINTILGDGIPILVKDSIKKVSEHLKEYIQRFQSDANSASIANAEQRLQWHSHLLERYQKELQDDLEQQVSKFKSLVEEQVTHLIDALKIHLTKPEAEWKEKERQLVNRHKTFFDNLHQNIQKIKDKNIKSLMESSEPQTFVGNKQVDKAAAELTLAFKTSIKKFLYDLNADVPQKALKWSKDKKLSIENQLQKVMQVYSESFNIRLQEDVLKLEIPDDLQSEITQSFDVTSQRSAAPISGLRWIAIISTRILGGNEAITLDPLDVKRQLLTFAIRIAKEQQVAMAGSVEKVVAATLKMFSGNVSTEIKRIKAIVSETTDMLKNKKQDDLGKLRDSIQSVLNQMAELEQSI